jgi:hypothetical protein
MCGIAGYIAKDQPSAEAVQHVFALMGVFMEERGTDSWGWTNGTDIDKYKHSLQQNFDLRKHGGAMTAAIHTRHATTGATIAENSHPWKFEHEGRSIIGMHNGMIYNHRDLTKQHQRDKSAIVDSQHIFLHILEGRDLSELEGYGTIFYWEGRDVWFGRFNGGDLEVADTEYGLVFCSTKWAIDYAFRVMGQSDKVKAWYSIEQGIFYRFNQDEKILYKSGVPLNISKGSSNAKWDDRRTGVLDWPEYTNTSGISSGTQSSSTPNANLYRNYFDDERCNWCNTWLMADDERYDTVGAGMLCEECAQWYFRDDDDKKTDDYEQTSAAKLDGELRMVECGVCTITIVNDEPVFINLKSDENMCGTCYRAETADASESKDEAKDRAKILTMGALDERAKVPDVTVIDDTEYVN